MPVNYRMRIVIYACSIVGMDEPAVAYSLAPVAQKFSPVKGKSSDKCHKKEVTNDTIFWR